MTDVTIAPDSDDVDALSRLVVAEAANIEADYETTFAGQSDAPQKAMTLAYGSIIDSVLNRVAAGAAEYGTTIQNVIDKHATVGGDVVYQYSSLPANSATSWSGLPAASSTVTDFVGSYLTARAEGQDSLVGAATHYYNPNISSPSWGPDLESKTDVGGGSDNEHLFGTLPATDAVPNNYTLEYGGNSTTFLPFPPIPQDKPVPVIDAPINPDAIDLGPQITPDTVLTAVTPWASAPHEGSPLIIDLSSGHTGIELTTFDASTTSTFFDIEGTGYAVQTAWTSGTTSGFLVDDLNSNGKIDSVNEMFGSPTVDGFAKLAELDSNHDLKIDSHDTAWSSLQVWIDAFRKRFVAFATGGDGITDSDGGGSRTGRARPLADRALGFAPSYC